MENNLEEKLSAILSDPAAMEKIQALAQSLGQSNQEQPPSAPMATPTQNMPLPDMGMLRSLTALAGNQSPDPNQQALLQALTPYVSRGRISKLENAMRAARLARLASGLLGSGALQSLLGRNGHV